MGVARVPVVEMLWEACDPRHALDERFGFADGAGAARWVTAVLAEHWGVRVDSCERLVLSGGNALAWVDTSSGRLIAKWSVLPARFGWLAATARLTRWLDGQGLPVSAPVPASDGRVQVELDGASMCLQREVDGELLSADRPGQVRAAGVVLARLQDALAAYPDADRFAALAGPSESSSAQATATVPEPLGARIAGWLDSDAEHAPAAGRDRLRRLLADAPPELPPAQLLHLDFRAANLLCAGDEVVAILDFEEARFDHRIVELSRAAVLLGTWFHDWGPVSADVRAQFLAGYRSVRELTPIEQGWWDVVLLWHALAMVPPGDDPTGWGQSALQHLATADRA